MKVVNRLKIKPAKSELDENQAERIAVLAFGFLAAEPEYFSRFASLTGIDIGDVGEMADTPEFLSAVLAYLLVDDSLLLTFCQNNDLQPESINKAHRALGGGNVVN